MQTGYYILSGVTVVAGASTLNATGIQVPGASSETVNFASFIGLDGEEGTPSGFLLFGPAGQIAVINHAIDADTVQLAAPWVGANVTAGAAVLVPGLNALPIGAHALKILQMVTQGGLAAANNLAEYAGDPTAQGEAQTNLGISTFIKTLLDDANAGAALTTLGVSTFIKTLLDDADASAAQTTLGISTFIKTLLDDANAGAAQTTLGISTFIKTLLDDADAGAAQTTLGISTFIKTLLDDADATSARTTLGAQATLGFTPVNKAGDTLTGPLLINGGRTILQAVNEVFALGLRYGASSGQAYIGASNSATPDIVFSAVGGGELARMANSGLVTAPGLMQVGPARSAGRSSFGDGTTNGVPLEAYASHAGKTGDVMEISAVRAASSAWNALMIYSSVAGSANALFYVDGAGDVRADGSFTGGGADYAEFFEWLDGNPGEEDRVGRSVVVDAGKIRPALENDDPAAIIGVVSATPSVVGDAAHNHWAGRYLRDDFGRYLFEDYETVSWVEIVEVAPARDAIPAVPETRDDDGAVLDPGAPETPAVPAVLREIAHSYDADAVPDDVAVPDDAEVAVLRRRVVNPAYDHAIAYVPRERRPEWAAIGLMGKLKLRAGEPVGPRWLCLREISPNVAEWLVR